MDPISREYEHESLQLFEDPETGMSGCVAIHSTALGPAMGGLRLSTYEGIGAAAVDALRLSRAMSLKNAAAGLDLGGGKAVLIDDGEWEGGRRAERMRAFGAFIEVLGGSYVTAEDVGTNPADMESIAAATAHVAGRPTAVGGRGDPSPATARTVFAAIVACVGLGLDGDRLDGLSVGVEGVGHVGSVLVGLLCRAGAAVEVCDVDPARAEEVAKQWGAVVVPRAGFATRDFDVFAPCALGGAVTATVISQMRCRLVAGAANNQLADRGLALEMSRRGIVYVPDFIANCGGIIHVGAEPLGFDEPEVERRIEAAGRRTAELLRNAAASDRTPLEIAFETATERIGHGRGRTEGFTKAI